MVITKIGCSTQLAFLRPRALCPYKMTTYVRSSKRPLQTVLLPLAACSALVMATVVAAARSPVELSVALRYDVDPALRGCPSEAEFRRAVTGQLGYDPFRSEAAHHVAAQVQESESGIDGQLLWTDATGTKEGERKLASTSRDCREFVRGLTFAIAVQIQMFNSTAANDPPADSSSAPPTPSLPDAGPPSEARPILPAEPSDRYFAAGLGPFTETGSAPSVTGGARLFGMARSRTLSLELGVKASLPITLRQWDGTGFTLSSYAVTLAPCAHVRGLALCAIGTLRRVRVEGFGIDDPRAPDSATAQVGVRLALAHLLSPRLALAIYAEGLGNLTPQRVYLNDMPVWTPRLLSFALGIDGSVLFR
jgi:hypothetical protein